MNSIELSHRIRLHAIEMTHRSHGSHIGSVLSVADIVGVLYADVLNYRSKEPKWEGRDRFILSKGHAGAAVYAALSECGFFDLELLKSHYTDGSVFSGHVSHKGVPGVEFSTGSLGHGLPAGSGMAMAAKLDGKKHHVHVIISDGECDEGTTWEAALFAAHFNLDNLIVTIDRNMMQSLDFSENTLRLEPLADKWRVFGWRVFELDGHNHASLLKAYQEASEGDGRPSVLVARTVKGKGVSFMENNILWHYRFPHDGGEYEGALAELEAQAPKGSVS